MSFISSNTEFGIVSDNEITSIITNFSDDMIMDIIRVNSENKFRPYQFYVGNLIQSIESTFKANLDTYPQYYSEVSERREEVYSKILESLCKLHGLVPNYDENVDLYSLTYFLYDFLISRFTMNVVNFYVNYIIAEIETIYQYLNLGDLKKNKDASTLYSKKVFKDNQKLAIVHANIEPVIDAICGFDVDLEALVMMTTKDKCITSTIVNNISEITNLFNNLYVPYVKNPSCRAILITMIRMRLQEIMGERIIPGTSAM